nr:unnamed protein product [Callosobruchus chinensis]CAH7717628.1 unnamed protein product [Callosobruchus chinensis]CAH7734350.1 unnamed protein product [Callosobruchus chinensis]
MVWKKIGCYAVAYQKMEHVLRQWS